MKPLFLKSSSRLSIKSSSRLFIKSSSRLFCIPAFLAFATAFAYAQDAGQDSRNQSDESLYGNEQEGAVEQGSFHDFSEADKDGDGALSTAEAQEALPDLIIVDINNDGILNRSEAENAMPGVRFDESGQASQAGQEGQAGQDSQTGQAGRDAPVGEAEYLIIVQTLEEQNRRDQAQTSQESRQQGQDEDA